MSRADRAGAPNASSLLARMHDFRWQLGIGVALALLLVCTRGVHPLRIEALPTATCAVFFAGGLLLRRWGTFVAFFCLAAAIDLGCLAAGTVTHWCISPAYWVLVPSYACLWLGGRLSTRAYAFNVKGLLWLALAMAVAEAAAYLISAGGFRFLSGRYPDPTWASFAPVIVPHYLGWLMPMGIYVGVGVAMHALVRWVDGHQPRLEARRHEC